MILTDLISEYKYVHETLEPCCDYFITVNRLINNFFAGMSELMATYSKITSPVESEKLI